MMRTYLMPALTGILILSVVIEAGAAAMRFTVTNPAELDQRTVARVSIPVPEGEMGDTPAVVAVMRGDEVLAAQAHVITRHPDESVRRMMLSMPISLAAGEEAELVCEPAAPVHAPASMLSGEEPARIATEAFDVVASRGRVQIVGDGGQVLATLAPFGPVEGEAETSLSVLEAGPHFVWLRYSTAGEEWSREVDVEVDRRGKITLTHRIQAHPAGDHWTPDFGWTMAAPGASGVDLPEGPVYMLGRDPSSRFADGANADLIAQLALADGTEVSVANPLALRQNRGTWEVAEADGAVRLRSNRNEPVDDIETEGLMIQEGAWRFSKVTIAPVQRERLAARLDAPVYGHADWRLYDAVYRTGPPLQVEHPVLRDAVEKMTFALQDMQMKGDDLGSMPWGWSPQQTTPDYTSSVRLNHSLYVWEDWFRTGDARLYRVVHDWCRNYRDLGMYWGPDPALYGACRRGNAWRDRPGHGPGTFNPRFATAPIYVHKGWSNFWLMYEETGDPRYRHAAEAAAEWSIANQHAGLGYTRTVGVVADAVKMYEYTGDQKHLDNAVRLWETFQPTQGEDLLFTESGKPAVGNDLYIGEDAFGYRNPFVKPYIVQYATNALPYLLQHTPDDQRLRDTIIALNDWMATHRQPGGGWGYPHYLAAGQSWNLEYIHGILLAHEIEPKDIYLDAAADNLRPTIQLCELYGWPASGLNPWEYAAGIDAQERQERYELATDRPTMPDYEQGQVKFSRSPDSAAYFQVDLRDYLKHRSEDSLLESTELLEKIRQLPTTLDPNVIVPARVALGEDGLATLLLTVDFRSPLPTPASATIVGLPEGVTADPETVEWTARRGRHQSPEFRLSGTLAEETSVTVQWQIGLGWEGARQALLTPGVAVGAGAKVGYIGGADDPLGLALLALGFDAQGVESVAGEALQGFDALLVGCEAHYKNFAGLGDQPQRLIDFARSGGRVAVFQLQDSGYQNAYLPLPLSLSDEEASLGGVRAPDHPIFREPNAISSLAGAVMYDTITGADPGWRVLAVDDAGQPAVIEAQVGDGTVLVVQPSIDRYVVGTVEPPEGLSTEACTRFLINVLHYVAS
ncbi:MAG: hypothetical protein ACP5KN_12540 [Armatimonadota bacterium]